MAWSVHSGGQRQSGGKPDCDDGKLCTTDVCDDGAGCTHALNLQWCNADNGTCKTGACVATAAKPLPTTCQAALDANPKAETGWRWLDPDGPTGSSRRLGSGAI